MGSYQPGVKGQPSPIKWQAPIRSSSPFEYCSEETAYAELKSSLMMMCARKSDSRVLTDAWATRNMKAASMANVGQVKKVPTPGTSIKFTHRKKHSKGKKERE
jgi:hypothetical protein